MAYIVQKINIVHLKSYQDVVKQFYMKREKINIYQIQYFTIYIFNSQNIFFNDKFRKNILTVALI